MLANRSKHSLIRLHPPVHPSIHDPSRTAWYPLPRDDVPPQPPQTGHSYGKP